MGIDGLLVRLGSRYANEQHASIVIDQDRAHLRPQPLFGEEAYAQALWAIHAGWIAL